MGFKSFPCLEQWLWPSLSPAAGCHFPLQLRKCPFQAHLLPNELLMTTIFPHPVNSFLIPSRYYSRACCSTLWWDVAHRPKDFCFATCWIHPCVPGPVTKNPPKKPPSDLAGCLIPSHPMLCLAPDTLCQRPWSRQSFPREDEEAEKGRKESQPCQETCGKKQGVPAACKGCMVRLFSCPSQLPTDHIIPGHTFQLLGMQSEEHRQHPMPMPQMSM